MQEVCRLRELPGAWAREENNEARRSAHKKEDVGFRGEAIGCSSQRVACGLAHRIGRSLSALLRRPTTHGWRLWQQELPLRTLSTRALLATVCQHKVLQHNIHGFLKTMAADTRCNQHRFSMG